MNPSEAAALAALRRLNNDASNGASSSRNAASTSLQDPGLPSRIANPAAGDNRARSSPPDQSNPTLIPLYDYSLPGHSNHTTAATTPRGGASPPRSTEINVTSDTFPRRNSEASTHSRQQSIPGSSGSHSEYAHSPNSNSQIPISHLPPTLTDEQLTLMDQVTREAIDERLRVLEGVSGAVYRCIDDLMRMRSALPSPAPTQPSRHLSPSLDSRISSLTEEIQVATTDNTSHSDVLTTSTRVHDAEKIRQPDQQGRTEAPGPSNILPT